MNGFTKLHRSIVTSSIWGESPSTRCVWVTMLAEADQDGIVEASVGGLARLANVTREECEAALETFLGPDPDSRDGTTGERIEKVRGGWRLLNHAHYRRLGSAEERRERDTERKRKARGHVRTDADTERTDADSSASASASASESDLPSSDLSQLPPTQDCTDAREGPRVRIVSDAPPALARLRSGYQARYESAVGDAWMGNAAAHRHLVTIAEWAERQAQIRGRPVGQVVAEWLDALFALERLREHRWPLKWASEDPAAVLGEAQRPSRVDRVERQRLEESLEEELSKIRYESRPHVLEPAQKRIAELRKRLGQSREARSA